MDELTEQLSAYLDGELDADARAAGRRIAGPRPAGSRRAAAAASEPGNCSTACRGSKLEPSFTQTTVEMVALAAAEEPAQPRADRWLRPLVIAWALAAAGYGGFATARSPGPTRTKNCCTTCRWSNNSTPTGRPATSASSASWPRPTCSPRRSRPVSSNRSRRVALSRGAGAVRFGGGRRAERASPAGEKMPPAQKQLLLENQQRLAKLEPDEQERLRTFAADLETGCRQHAAARDHAPLRSLD